MKEHTKALNVKAQLELKEAEEQIEFLYKFNTYGIFSEEEP